ncbi:MAG: hypothetical protein ABIH36_03695 [bacterium]
MTPKTKKDNENKPATKADVANLSEDIDHLAIATKNTFTRLEKDISGLKKGQANLEKGQAGLKENQERILSIVQSIDEHFKEYRDLPGKVENLEVDVFKLQTRPR